MEAIGLSFIDWVIIIIDFGFVLGIGMYLRKYTLNQEDFFLAGRKNSVWVAGLAFLSAKPRRARPLGMTGNTFKYGMYVAHFYFPPEDIDNAWLDLGMKPGAAIGLCVRSVKIVPELPSANEGSRIRSASVSSWTRNIMAWSFPGSSKSEYRAAATRALSRLLRTWG